MSVSLPAEFEKRAGQISHHIGHPTEQLNNKTTEQLNNCSSTTFGWDVKAASASQGVASVGIETMRHADGFMLEPSQPMRFSITNGCKVKLTRSETMLRTTTSRTLDSDSGSGLQDPDPRLQFPVRSDLEEAPVTAVQWIGLPPMQPRNPANSDTTQSSIDDAKMVTHAMDSHRRASIGSFSTPLVVSNNTAARRNSEVLSLQHARIDSSPLCLDDIRAKAAAGLDASTRPLWWRILLGVMNPEDPTPYAASLIEKRAQYHRWRREFQTYRVQQPQEQEPEECKSSEKVSASQNDTPPYARDVSLLKEIEKDVSRTQSELPFFSDGGMQQQWMLRILFVYAKLNPELGYMQGMNEILAPLVFVFGSDENEELANQTEPDAFYAFCEIMNSAKLLYSKSPKDPSKTGVETQMTRLTLLLRQHDALLWQHLNSIGLSPDFYSFRWYMTLLAREFPMTSTLRIWDALLSDPKRFSFLHYVSCALIRSQRAKLLNEGFTGALKLLQSLPVVDVEPLLQQARDMRDKDRNTDHARRLSISLSDVPSKMAEHEPHIVLYFDVNKTVIMHDPVQGKGLHHILNDLLTERAFGFASDDGETWTWNGEPVLSTEHSSGHHHDAISYGMFLRAKYPMSSDPAKAKHNKKMRKLLRQDFTAPGSPGHGVAHEHDALLAKLRLPSLSDTACSQSSDLDTALAAAGLDTESGYFFVIPAFFRFLQFLHERGTKFNLVFRTYGDDLHRIAQEFNLFCSGKHPYFSPGTTLMDGSDGSVDRRLHLSTVDGSDHRFGTFFRGAQDTTVLVMGTFQQPKTVSEDYTSFYQQRQQQQPPNGVQMVHGMDSIHSFLTKRWRDSQATLALRDFYPYWFHHVEDARAGKLLTVDETDQSVHAIFFDDNILAHEPHIVDARSVPDGQSIAWERARELYLLRVEPLEAVRDETYFIHRFLASLDKRSSSAQE